MISPGAIPHEQIPAFILVPLGVAPKAQNQGVGGRLIKEGLSLLWERGIKLVFVLGYPEYYPRHGFKAALTSGWNLPVPFRKNTFLLGWFRSLPRR